MCALPSVISYAGTISASTGGSSLTHGASFTVTGSGFGSKTGHNTRFDNASGTVPTAIWDYAWPSDANSTFNIQYRSVYRSVAMPHSRTSKYIVGGHDPAQSSTSNGRNVLLGVNFTKSFPTYSRWELYRRIDPSWNATGSFADNHKFYGLADGSGSPYSGGNDGKQNWYIEYRGGGDFPTSFTWHINDDHSTPGTGIDVSSPYGDVESSIFTGWNKVVILMRWNSSSSGLLSAYTHRIGSTRTTNFNQTQKTDGYTDSNNRSEAIEGYAGNADSNNFRYMADVFYDHGANDAVLYLTDNATFASSTIIEVQPWTSWSSTSITATCNGGALSSGTVHVHVRSIENGNQYLGTQTLT